MSGRLRLVAAMTRTSTLRLHVVGADGLHLAVLEEPQQQRLHAQAHLADFVEEQRAAVRQLQLAELVAVGAGEAALHVAEQLRFEQRLGQARAVDRDERARGARGAQWMSRATRSLPTPLSPVMSTFASPAATRSTSARMSAICWLALTMTGAGGEGASTRLTGRVPTPGYSRNGLRALWHHWRAYR